MAALLFPTPFPLRRAAQPLSRGDLFLRLSQFLIPGLCSLVLLPFFPETRNLTPGLLLPCPPGLRPKVYGLQSLLQESCLPLFARRRASRINCFSPG